MTDEKQCPKCGGTIPADAPAGECPACLLAAGLESGGGAGAMGPPQVDDEELAGLFPNLEIEARIGQGGMGVVYRARQKSLNRVVALKLLPRAIGADPLFAERFTREAQALAMLNHPNIVTVYEAGQVEGLCYLVMEFVDGVNLRQAEKSGSMTPKEALAIVPQVCDALQYAHDHGVVHRDIKPENILLDQRGTVKIADFGLAKLLAREGDASPTLTSAGQVMGTLHYLAPEQIQTPKDVDHRADIYSLGVVFYEMLTGQLPLGRFAKPSEKVQVDVRLDEVVLRTLEVEPERRYQQAGEVKTGVLSIDPDTASSARPAPKATPAAAPTASHFTGPAPERRLSMLALAGLLAVPAALLVWVLIVALGARDEYANLAAGAIAFSGLVISCVAYHSILAAPDRLHGLTLARLGAMIPVGAAVMFGGAAIGALLSSSRGGMSAGPALKGMILMLPVLGVLTLLTFGVLFIVRPRGEHGKLRHFALFLLPFLLLGALGIAVGKLAMRSRAATEMEFAGGYSAAMADFGRQSAEDRMAQLLVIVDALGGMADLEEIAALGDPRAYDWFMNLPDEEFQRLYDDEALGLAMMKREPHDPPLATYDVLIFDVSGDRARVVLAHSGQCIEFDLVRVHDQWFFALEKIERYSEPH
jgi:predicted Ser/Thr protein kinase